MFVKKFFKSTEFIPALATKTSCKGSVSMHLNNVTVGNSCQLVQPVKILCNDTLELSTVV